MPIPSLKDAESEAAQARLIAAMEAKATDQVRVQLSAVTAEAMHPSLLALS